MAGPGRRCYGRPIFHPREPKNSAWPMKAPYSLSAGRRLPALVLMRSSRIAPRCCGSGMEAIFGHENHILALSDPVMSRADGGRRFVAQIKHISSLLLACLQRAPPPLRAPLIGSAGQSPAALPSSPPSFLRFCVTFAVFRPSTGRRPICLDCVRSSSS